jgi:hypothetical protein
MPINDRDDMMAQIAVLVPEWTLEEIQGFLAAAPDEQIEILKALNASMRRPPPSVWPTIMSILTVALTIATDVSGIAGAISAVQTVMKS